MVHCQIPGTVLHWNRGPIRVRGSEEGMIMADHATAEHTKAEHTHGENCGHEAEQHGDHVHYLHDGHRHSEHEDHYDECP